SHHLDPQSARVCAPGIPSRAGVFHTGIEGEPLATSPLSCVRSSKDSRNIHNLSQNHIVFLCLGSDFTHHNGREDFYREKSADENFVLNHILLASCPWQYRLVNDKQAGRE
ncbi:hypothetical protein E2I00_011641, partial [Balaenoptera physalus]